MPVSSPTFKPIISVGALQITIQEATTVLNQTTIALPALTKSFILRSRTPCSIKISDSLGGQYITVKPYCTFELENLEITGKILYIESSIPVTTIEVLITHG
jgi:hypothetical protein